MIISSFPITLVLGFNAANICSCDWNFTWFEYLRIHGYILLGCHCFRKTWQHNIPYFLTCCTYRTILTCIYKILSLITPKITLFVPSKYSMYIVLLVKFMILWLLYMPNTCQNVQSTTGLYWGCSVYGTSGDKCLSNITFVFMANINEHSYFFPSVQWPLMHFLIINETIYILIIITGPRLTVSWPLKYFSGGRGAGVRLNVMTKIIE